jgi:hypothetical protein
MEAASPQFELFCFFSSVLPFFPSVSLRKQQMLCNVALLWAACCCKNIPEVPPSYFSPHVGFHDKAVPL